MAETAAGTAAGMNLGARCKPAHRILGLAALAITAFFFLPAAFFVQPGFGLEASWRLLLNKALSEGWLFGDRLIWTYGPLGFLDSRFPQGLSLWHYASFDALVLALFVWFALDVVKLKLDRPLLLACLACLPIAKKLVNDMPSTAMFCLVIFLLVRNVSRPTALTSAWLVLASAVMFLFKQNFGFVSPFLCGLVFLGKQSAREKSAWLWLLLVILQALLVWVAAGPFHLDLWGYIKDGLAIIRQYSDGMMVGPGRGSVSFAAVCFLFAGFVWLVASSCYRQRYSRETMIYGCIGLAAAFVLYKTAVVRSDYLRHQGTFLFGLPLIGLALLVHGPESLRRASRWVFLSSTAYAVVLLLAEHGDCFIYIKKDSVKRFLPIAYAQTLRDHRRHTDWRAYAESAQQSSPERLVPGPVRQLVGQESVDVFPYEGTLAMASGLNYQARPVPQSYAVMGRTLEARNLAFYQGAGAPRFAFYVLGAKAVSIDDRYQLWDEPALKRVLQQQYGLRLAFTNLQGALPETSPGLSPVLLLEREPAAAPAAAEAQGGSTERAGRAFTLPPLEGELYARIQLKKTLLGRLASFFYRGAPVRAWFLLEDNRERDFRVIPANLESGVLVNYFADGDDAESMKNYLVNRSRGNPRCRTLTLRFDRWWEYHRDFQVSYFHFPAGHP